MADLIFNDSFPSTLKEDAERVLRTKLVVGEKFKSADSFSYLLSNNSDKYVGKIFRFEHWPPQGKLEYLDKLLKQNDVPHEEILFSSYEHPIFKFGWQLSQYIPGETARTLRDNPNWSKEEYLIKLGKLLRQVHKIKFDYFGSLHSQDDRFDNFQEFVQLELEEQDFSDLPSDYVWAQEIIASARNEVLNILTRFSWKESTLVHDDANDSNVIWQNGNPILIDWVDSLAAPPLRDFATMTFREDEPIISFLEKGYGQAIDQQELRFHQVMRFIRLGRFFYFEDKDVDELHKMMNRLKNLLQNEKPFGA